MKKLTPQQIAFCNNLLQVDQDGSRSMMDYEAYQKAFPAVNKKASAKAGASRLLKQDNVQAYLAKRRGEVEAAVNEKVVITKERILEEEGYIAFHDIGQLFDPDTGQPVENITMLPEDIRRAIASIEVKESEVAGVKSKTWKIKINDKGRSLDRLEKCFGMQRDKVDVDAVITLKSLLEEIDGSTRGKLPIDME